MVMKNTNNIAYMTGTADGGEGISAIPLSLALAPKVISTLSLTIAAIWNPVRKEAWVIVFRQTLL